LEKAEFEFSSWKEITTFTVSTETLFMRQLCGLPCGFNQRNEGPRITQGLFVLDTTTGHYEADDFHLHNFSRGQDSIKFELFAGETGLMLTSYWEWDSQSHIWSRRDLVENKGPSVIILSRCLARFSLAPDHYTHITQSSSWSHENQLQINYFDGGKLSIYSQGGRTTQGASPYLFTACQSLKRSLAFHLLPCGDWTLQVDQTRSAGDTCHPFSVIEMGVTDVGLRYELKPGQTIHLPEILIQAIDSVTPEEGSPALQEYVLRKKINFKNGPHIRPSPPIVYNTWFDAFECLDMERLRRQLLAAAAAGCEVFTIDAGWYGNSQGSWHQQVGDWREKEHEAFHGKMADFAEEVRESGLGFGLWVEPERCSTSAPVFIAHPEWFLPGDGGFYYPDLTMPEAYHYLFSELGRLIQSYKLAWMKIDFNFELGSSKDGFHEYYQHWYSLMDELRLTYPDVFIEGCASGGMRLDLNTLAHVDAHFVSDTVNPYSNIRITQGAALRLPLSRLTKWAVLRSLQNQVVSYGLPVEQAPERVVTPAGADWEAAFVIDLDFCYRTTLPGIPGLSGDLASLSKDRLVRLKQHNQFYKDWRNFISNSVCELITSIKPQGDLNGWVVFRLYTSGVDESLLLVYRLDDDRSRVSFPLPGINPSLCYEVFDIDAQKFPRTTIDGEELMSKGIEIEIPKKIAAKIFVLHPIKV